MPAAITMSAISAYWASIRRGRNITRSPLAARPPRMPRSAPSSDPVSPARTFPTPSRRSSLPTLLIASRGRHFSRPIADWARNLSRRRSMPLPKNGSIGSDDWITLGTDDHLPESGDVVIPHARLLKEWESLTDHDGRLGVVFTNIDRIE